MKKILALSLAVLMAFSMAACTASGDEESTPSTESTTEATTESTTEATTQPQVQAPESALKVLEDTWALYADEEKFAVAGGADVMGAPGALTDMSSLAWTLYIPEDKLADIDEAATMIHMMNANTFTSGVVHLKDGVDAAAFGEAMKEVLKNNQWMCGFPQKLIISDLGGGYVLISFGNGELLDAFAAKLATAYPGAAELYNEEV